MEGGGGRKARGCQMQLWRISQILASIKAHQGQSAGGCSPMAAAGARKDIARRSC